MVDIFRADDPSEPFLTEHIDSIGDLLDQRFYELLKINGEVKLRLKIIDEKNWRQPKKLRKEQTEAT